MTTLQNGRYVLRRELGDDACGSLYLAQDSKIAQREVAIRKIAADALTPTLLQRIAQLNHPSLPSVYDVFEEENFHYIVMEHPHGKTLADIALGPRIKESLILNWAKQIAAALNYLHSLSPSMAHGDVRPSNIVLQDGRQIKLINGMPSGCSTIAASRYTAPEILSVKGTPPSVASDIYALGATLHHVLTGIDPNTQPLMSFAPPGVRRPDVSASTTATIVQALSADPQQRFASVNEMMHAFTATAELQASDELPVIGFTPSYPTAPADGPTQRYTPTPDMPVPIPAQSNYHPDSYNTVDHEQARYDAYTAQQQAWQAPPPPPSANQPVSESGSGRLGYMALGALLILLFLGGGFWMLNRNVNQQNPPTSMVGGPTITGEEGRVITDAEHTATALALLPTRPNATTIPTFDAPRATADALQTYTAATAAAVDNDIEAIYQRALGYENTGQYGLAISDYDEVLRRRPDYKDAQQRRDTLQNLLNATTIAGNVQATSNAQGTATVAAIPTMTATPVPPTATPVGQVINDSFDKPTLDPLYWEATTNNGTITFENGEMKLDSQKNDCFPTVRALTDTFKLNDNFDLTVTFRYGDITPLGTGFMFADAMPDMCGDKDRAGTAWGGVWQDLERGMVVEFHRDSSSTAELKDIRWEYSQKLIDQHEHTFTLQRRNGRDTYIMDGQVLFEEAAGAKPSVLWFGNPVKAPVQENWTQLYILNVDVRQEP